MNVKKIIGLFGVISCVLLLVLVGAQVITWRFFWFVIILLAAFAYWILPGMSE